MSSTEKVTRSAPIVSYIIPNWNHRQLLYECIVSIYDSMDSIPGEVIVVDNASTDGSEECIRKPFPEVIWIQNKTNRGYAVATNQGIEIAQGKYFFLLNNDIKLMDNAAEKLLAFLKEHPDAGAIAPLLFYPDGRIQESCRRFPSPSALLLEWFDINRVGPWRRWKLNISEHLTAGVVQQPMTSALLITRKCWETVGSLDEQFPIFFNDVDWCYRLYKNTTYKIYLYPEAKAIHYKGASANLLKHKKKVEFYKGLFKFYRKHFPFSLW